MWSLFGIGSDSPNVKAAMQSPRDLVAATIAKGRSNVKSKDGNSQKEWNIIDRLLYGESSTGDVCDTNLEIHRR